MRACPLFLFEFTGIVTIPALLWPTYRAGNLGGRPCVLCSTSNVGESCLRVEDRQILEAYMRDAYLYGEGIRARST